MPTAAPYRYEAQAWRTGLSRIAGIDEAGRGPLAGPVVAAAVVIAPERRIKGLCDSKVLPAEKREALFAIISEREALLRLRAEGTINDQVLRELERELDLEERRMDA